jgi:hypothetical protein
MVRLHPHAKERLIERGATENEVIATVKEGETFPAKYGRTGFRRNFSFNGKWQEKQYATKQIEAYTVREGNDWLVITVIIRYF